MKENEHDIYYKTMDFFSLMWWGSYFDGRNGGTLSVRRDSIYTLRCHVSGRGCHAGCLFDFYAFENALLILPSYLSACRLVGDGMLSLLWRIFLLVQYLNIYNIQKNGLPWLIRLSWKTVLNDMKSIIISMKQILV